MVDESEPTDYNICQNLWRNVPRNATENRRGLYCVFAKLVKQNNIILSPDLADSICQHIVGHSGRVDLVDWYSRSWYECIVYTRGVSIPSEQLQAIILYINKVDLYKTRNLRENVLLLGPMLQKTGSKSKLLDIVWNNNRWLESRRLESKIIETAVLLES